MNMQTFEKLITEVMGYASIASFAAQTQLVSRSSLSKWKKTDEIPPLMAAFIKAKAELMQQSFDGCRVIIVGTNTNNCAYISNSHAVPMLGDEEQLLAYEIESTWLEPEYRLGDLVLAKPNNKITEGSWLFEIKDTVICGFLNINFDGTFTLEKSLKHKAILHFGEEHLNNGIKPLGKIKYHIKKQG